MPMKPDVEAQALSYLSGGDAARAAQLIAAYEAQQRHPRGVGIDWTHGMPSHLIAQAEQLIRGSCEDLALDDRRRRLIGVHLALSLFWGERLYEAATRLLTVMDGHFPCADLVTFLKTCAPNRLLHMVKPDKPEELAQLYAQTKLSTVAQMQKLQQLLNNRVWSESLGLGKGVKLSCVKRDRCTICTPGQHVYRWAETECLPALPRHWGCRCGWVLWM